MDNEGEHDELRGDNRGMLSMRNNANEGEHDELDDDEEEGEEEGYDESLHDQHPD